MRLLVRYEDTGKLLMGRGNPSCVTACRAAAGSPCLPGCCRREVVVWNNSLWPRATQNWSLVICKEEN